MSRQKFIFVHVPKCAGKSFKLMLTTSVGKADVFNISNNPLNIDQMKTFKQRLLETCKYSARFVVYNTIFLRYFCVPRFVIGHFSVRQFSCDQSQFGTILRDPIDLVGSYLSYYSKKYPSLISGNVIGDILALGLDRIYLSFFRDKPFSEFDYVGLVSDLPRSLVLFSKVTGVSVQEVFINSSNTRDFSYREYFHSLGVLTEIEALLSPEIEMYTEGVARFDSLCRSYEV